LPGPHSASYHDARYDVCGRSRASINVNFRKVPQLCAARTYIAAHLMWRTCGDRRLSDVTSEPATRAVQFHQLDERERVSAAGLVAIARVLNAFYSHFA